MSGSGHLFRCEQVVLICELASALSRPFMVARVAAALQPYRIVRLPLHYRLLRTYTIRPSATRGYALEEPCVSCLHTTKMILKKPSIPLSSYSHFHSFAPLQYCTSPQRPCMRPKTTQNRNYATIADKPPPRDDHSAQVSDFAWSLHPAPTPYQILNHTRGAPYSKHRFNELVKFYHPDRTSRSPVTVSASSAVCLERYRLIVAAHTILTDPIRRNAYDLYGSGWDGRPEAESSNHGRPPNWRPPHSPMANATWEDWERWYQGDQKPPQAPVYLSNAAFVGLIVMFAALGGVGQATRAQNSGLSFVEQRNATHDKVSKELKRVRMETRVGGSKDERIQAFLRNRDSSMHAEEVYRRMLPDPEVCSSGDVEGRDMNTYKANQCIEPDIAET